MKVLTLAVAISLAAALAGCNRNAPGQVPAPKTSAATSSSAAGDSAPVRSSANSGAGNSADNRNGANPHQQQVDPNQAEQRRDFQQSGDAAGPKSSGAAPTTRNK